MKRDDKGETLVMIMVAMIVGALLLPALAAFIIAMTRATVVNQQRTTLNGEVIKLQYWMETLKSCAMPTATNMMRIHINAPATGVVTSVTGLDNGCLIQGTLSLGTLDQSFTVVAMAPVITLPTTVAMP